MEDGKNSVIENNTTDESDVIIKNNTTDEPSEFEALFPDGVEEIDVTIQNFTYNIHNVVKKIKSPKESRFVINMVLDKYEDKIESLLDFDTTKMEEFINQDFKKKVKKDDVLLFWNTTIDNNTTFLALTINNVFGVDKNSNTYFEPLKSIVNDPINYFNDKFIQTTENINRIKETIFEMTSDLLRLETKNIQFSSHPIYYRDIHFREDYLRALFAMIVRDKKVFASEISKLYEYANFVSSLKKVVEIFERRFL